MSIFKTPKSNVCQSGAIVLWLAEVQINLSCPDVFLWNWMLVVKISIFVISSQPTMEPYILMCFGECSQSKWYKYNHSEEGAKNVSCESDSWTHLEY